MAKVRSTRIDGRLVLLDLRSLVGHHLSPGYAAEEIYIDGKQSDNEAFLTLIHEWMHARFPELTEKQVEQVERELGGLALRLFTVKKKDGAW